MGDTFNNHGRKPEATSIISAKKASKGNLVASGPKASPQHAHRHIVSLSQHRSGSDVLGDAAMFLLKLAALEAVRRVSRAKCPFVWRGVQALQFLCYPPLKWIQKWAPFKGLVKGMQMLSRPLLVLSIATAFSDQAECSNEASDSISGPRASSEPQSESPSVDSALDTRIADESPQTSVSENWLIQLFNELESQGIRLPERFNEDELRRFYTAANGDFSYLLSSIKKTIRWRETYGILSEQELEMWSNVVFWHGFDVRHRPCLIVRLGVACSNLPSHNRPRFAQAVISQVEHGILRFVDMENPQITVVVDCEGLSPMKIPMQMMRSCSSLLQDNFPDRLGCLFVIRLPPVVRVIAQTLIQVLKPITRKKFNITGKMYRKVLSEYLETLPSYLGGSCTCIKCSNISIGHMQWLHTNKTNKVGSNADTSDGEDVFSLHHGWEADSHINGNCDEVLRTAVIIVLMVWAFIALLAGLYDPDSG